MSSSSFRRGLPVRTSRRSFRRLNLEALEAREVPTFTATSTVSVGTAPRAIAMADFNRDGKLDFATGNFGGQTVSIRLGDGQGGISGSSEVSSFSGLLYSMAVGDFNGDGIPDLAVGHGNVDSPIDRVSIRLGDGQGGFTGSTEVTVGNDPYSLALGDFNGDGKLDFATANRTDYNSTVSVRLSDGQGGFSGSTNIPIGGWAESVAVGDFNRDGILDLAIALHGLSDSTVSVRLGVGDGTFTSAADVSVGILPTSVAVGDFNGDGIPDFATANYSANSVSVRLGDGLGGFSGSIEVGVAANPISLALGDFNGDGKLDLAATNYGANSVSVRLGDGQGGFLGSATIPVGDHPWPVAVGDFNGDGRPDLVVGNHFDYTVSVLRNDYAFSATTPYTSSPNVAVGTGPRSVAQGDFNRDGIPDLATTNFDDHSVSVRLGNGQGGFTGATSISVGAGPDGIAVGDFNRDGKPDFATANVNANTVSIRLGDGLGGFSGSLEVSVGASPCAVSAQDVNGDGKLDLAITNFGDNSVSIRLGDGQGGFTGATSISVGTNPISLALGDFNRDGKLDLATANAGADSVSIRLGDGVGGFAGSITVSVGASPEDIAVGDFNRDGILDLATTNFSGNSVSIRFGDGQGGFTGSANVSVGTNPIRLVVGDFNRDGLLDFVTTNAGDGTVSLRLGDGQGGFATSSALNVGTNPLGLVAGDFNRDGKLDFAVVNRDDNDVSIRVAAVNAQVRVPDVTAYFSASAQNLTLSANVTRDGSIVTDGSVLFTLMRGNTVIGTATSGIVDSNGVATISYALPAALAAGYYTITASFTGSGTTGYSTGTLTLYQAATSTVLTTNSPTTYGNDIVLTATVTVTAGSHDLKNQIVQFYNGTTFLGSRTIALVEGKYQAGWTIPRGFAAGDYTQLKAWYFSGDVFIVGGISLNVSHTVLKAPLTITPDSVSRYFGRPNPTFTATFTGLVNDDTSSVVTGLNLTTLATAASVPGSYAITGSGAAAANYAIIYAPVALRVLSLPLVAVGASTGSLPMVSTYDADGNQRTFQAYANPWTGGVRVATGDVNGDGYEDVVTASANGTPGIKVFSGWDGAFLTSFQAGRGTYVACADVLRLGTPQVLVGTAVGTVGHVHIFDLRSGRAVYKGAVRAFGPGYTGGVTVGGDDGVLVVGTATGNGTVRVFSGARLATKADLTPWAGYLAGVTVAASGGRIAVGKFTGDAEVKVYDESTQTLLRTLPILPAPSGGYGGGVRVAWTYDSAGAWTLVAGTGPGWPATTKYYAAATWELGVQQAEFNSTLHGIWVG